MIHRVKTFFQRIGFVQSVLYLLVLGYMAWMYSHIWDRGGQVFVLSVLGIGIGVGTALAPLMFRNYHLSHSIVSKCGWVLMLIWILVFRIPIRLSPLGYWAMHAALWLQLTLNFWIGSHDPITHELRRMTRKMRSVPESENEEMEEAIPANSRRAAPSEEENWYRRD